MMVLDHLTGYMYAYPRWVRLQVGTDMVFDRRDEKDRGPTPGLITRQFDDFVRYAEGSPAHALTCSAPADPPRVPPSRSRRARRLSSNAYKRGRFAPPALTVVDAAPMRPRLTRMPSPQPAPDRR